MKEIKLTNGSLALIDDDDYERVTAAGNWYEDTSGHGARTYAYRRFGRKKVYLHIFILGKSDLDTDHDNGNGLDCQKKNLIRKTRTFNNLNNHNERIDNSSGVRGVYFDSFYNGWKAEIKVNKKKYNLGVFTDKTLAAQARQHAENRVKQGLSPKEGSRS